MIARQIPPSRSVYRSLAGGKRIAPGSHYVPQRDGGDHQVETAGAILSILEGTVADLAQPIEEYSLGESVPGFALIEASRDAASQGRILQPGQCEQRALDPTDFPQGQSKPVLPWVSSQFPQNRRGRYPRASEN